MKKPISSEWQKHYDFASRTVERAQEMLAQAKVIDALGNKGVHLAAAMEYVRVRPVKNGEIEWSEDDTRESILAAALQPDQSVYIPQTGSNELQYMFGADLYDESVAYELLLDRDSPKTWTLDDSLAGMMVADTRIWEFCDREQHPMQLFIRGRPTILLRYEEYSNFESRALIMLHELDHAMNATIYPIHLSWSLQDYHLRNELSAYSTQSAIARALGVDDVRYMPHCIEKIRQEYNGDMNSEDAYRTDYGIAEKLAEVGFGDIHE